MAEVVLPDYILAENQRVADEIGEQYRVALREAFGLPPKPADTSTSTKPE